MRALVLSLALASCATSREQAAAATTIAVVETVDAGVDAFARWREVEEPRLAQRAITACHDVPDYAGCTRRYLADARGPSERVKAAIRAYRDALAVGTDAATVASLAADLAAQLGAVGIQVHGGTR